MLGGQEFVALDPRAARTGLILAAGDIDLARFIDHEIERRKRPT